MAVPTIHGYELHGELGRGGASVVFDATDLASGEAVAIKVFSAPGDHASQRKLARELDALVRLEAIDGVVRIRGTATTGDGRPAVVMDRYVESAADRLAREGPWSVQDVVTVGMVIAGALERLHEVGIVHRDIKPANVLIDVDERLALADFDIAAVGLGAESSLTMGSMTPPHTAPERLRGEDGAGFAGDIWALGSTLYTLLDGRPPFGDADGGGGVAGLVHRVSNEPVPRLTRGDVPAALWEALNTALAKRPEERFASAAAMRSALGAVPVRASTVPGAHRPRPHGGDGVVVRRWLTTAVIAGGSVAATAVALWALFR